VPILKSEVALAPPDLFDLPDLPWRVAYVRSRQEKELARLLLRAEVPYYLPLAEKRVRRAGRWFVSYLPLFPGYLFFRGPSSSEAARRALWDQRVVSVLEVSDQSQLAAELRTIRRLQESGAAFEAHPYLGPGDPVEVVEGPFRGAAGTVLRSKGRARLVVSVTFLRQSVAVEFERAALAPARPVSRTLGTRRRQLHAPLRA
jgi:transcription antitermination factor NusG